MALTLPLYAGSASSDSTNEKDNSSFDIHSMEIAESKEEEPSNKSEDSEPLVQISEVVIKGLEGHPSQKRLEYAAYDAMSIRPGSKVTRSEVKNDLNSVYSTGWFSAVSIDPINTPLGVQLLVRVEPNPSLKKIQI